MSRDFRLHLFRVACILAYGFLACAIDTEATPVHFLVSEIGEPVHHDSYVLPLSDPTAISHARDLISIGPSVGEAIVVAAIAAGSNGINRNYLSPGAPLWSWHVSEFQGFADNTIEILDGWPTYVESDVKGWIENTSGMIGFWRYTVVAELSPGDYNADRKVDAADYVVWRKNVGTSNILPNDAIGGTIGAVQYDQWRTNFGQSAVSGSSVGVNTTVPEPTTAVLLILAATWLVCPARHCRVGSSVNSLARDTR